MLTATTSSHFEPTPNRVVPLDEHYGYDGLYQVKTFRQGWLNESRTAIGGQPMQAEQFAYDPVGNWEQVLQGESFVPVISGQTRIHNQDNQIVQINGSSANLAYDKAGNMTQTPVLWYGTNAGSSSPLTLLWDAWNRLAGHSGEPRYSYDALFRRITKTAGGVTRHTYYSDRWKALEERANPGTLTLSRRWFWGARPGHRDELVFRERDINGDWTLEERLYCLMDYFSPAAIVNLSGAVLERYTFSAFGKRRVLSADYAARTNCDYDWEFGFQGQFLDLETWNGTGEQTGLYNYGYRYYVPALGRWPCRDPIGELGGVNLNSLRTNCAINVVDHLGLLDLGGVSAIMQAMMEVMSGDSIVTGPLPNCMGHACTGLDTVDVQPKPGSSMKDALADFGIECNPKRIENVNDCECPEGQTKIIYTVWHNHDGQEKKNGLTDPITWGMNLETGVGADFHFYRQAPRNDEFTAIPGRQPRPYKHDTWSEDDVNRQIRFSGKLEETYCCCQYLDQ